MRKLLTTAFVAATLSVWSQDLSQAVEILEDLSDQYGKHLDLKSKGSDVTIIYIPTTDQPFRVYDQFKEVKFKPNVVLVGGFGNPGGHGGMMPIDHLRDGFVTKYGKKFPSILLDPSSAVAKALGVKGHSVINISMRKKKVTDFVDYGNKFDDFMKRIDNYKQKGK